MLILISFNFGWNPYIVRSELEISKIEAYRDVALIQEHHRGYSLPFVLTLWPLDTNTFPLSFHVYIRHWWKTLYFSSWSASKETRWWTSVHSNNDLRSLERIKISTTQSSLITLPYFYQFAVENVFFFFLAAICWGSSFIVIYWTNW